MSYSTCPTCEQAIPCYCPSPRITLYDFETGKAEWTGTLEEFRAVNGDDCAAYVERGLSAPLGVFVGGGASPLCIVRREVSRPIR